MDRWKINIGMLLLAVLTMACTEEKHLYNDPTDIAMFGTTSRQFLVTDAVEDNVIDLVVCSPVKWKEDRTYVVKLLSGMNPETDAIEHTNFEMASSLLVVIPAGEYTGSFQVRAFQESLYDNADKYVYFALESLDQTHPVADFNTSLTLALTRVCARSIPDLAGKYRLVSEILGTEVSNLHVIADPEHADGLLVPGLYSEEALQLRLWPDERGGYQVKTRKPCSMGPLLTDSNGVSYDSEAVVTSGEYNPCSGRMVLEFFVYPVGNPNSGMAAVEEFIRY